MLAAPEHLPRLARVNTDIRSRLGIVGSILMPMSLHDPAPISIDGIHRDGTVNDHDSELRVQRKRSWVEVIEPTSSNSPSATSVLACIIAG